MIITNGISFPCLPCLLNITADTYEYCSTIESHLSIIVVINNLTRPLMEVVSGPHNRYMCLNGQVLVFSLK